MQKRSDIQGLMDILGPGGTPEGLKFLASPEFLQAIDRWKQMGPSDESIKNADTMNQKMTAAKLTFRDLVDAVMGSKTAAESLGHLIDELIRLGDEAINTVHKIDKAIQDAQKTQQDRDKEQADARSAGGGGGGGGVSGAAGGPSGPAAQGPNAPRQRGWFRWLRQRYPTWGSVWGGPGSGLPSQGLASVGGPGSGLPSQTPLLNSMLRNWLGSFIGSAGAAEMPGGAQGGDENLQGRFDDAFGGGGGGGANPMIGNDLGPMPQNWPNGGEITPESKQSRIREIYEGVRQGVIDAFTALGLSKDHGGTASSGGGTGGGIAGGVAGAPGGPSGAATTGIDQWNPGSSAKLADESGKVIDPETMAHISELGKAGKVQELQQFLNQRGFRASGLWCGRFATMYARAAGFAPPGGFAMASNWRTFGEGMNPADINAPDHPFGSMFASSRNYTYGGGRGPLPVGAQGGHVVTIIPGTYDAKAGTATVIDQGGVHPGWNLRGYETRFAGAEAVQAAAAKHAGQTAEPKKMARGGIVGEYGPELVQVGEQGPEMVTPLGEDKARAFARAIGRTETDFNADEAYTDKYNKPSNNANVRRYGQSGADYGYFQMNARDVDEAVSKYGMDRDVARHLAGGLGEDSTLEQQTAAVSQYMRLRWPKQFDRLVNQDDFEGMRRATQGTWFGLHNNPRLALNEYQSTLGLSGGGRRRRYAEGGIVTAPTEAVIGEKGPEAVVPLSGEAAGLSMGGALGGLPYYGPTISRYMRQNVEDVAGNIGTAASGRGSLGSRIWAGIKAGLGSTPLGAFGSQMGAFVHGGLEDIGVSPAYAEAAGGVAGALSPTNFEASTARVIGPIVAHQLEHAHVLHGLYNAMTPLFAPADSGSQPGAIPGSSLGIHTGASRASIVAGRAPRIGPPGMHLNATQTVDQSQRTNALNISNVTIHTKSDDPFGPSHELATQSVRRAYSLTADYGMN
jgi:hypothetical protein